VTKVVYKKKRIDPKPSQSLIADDENEMLDDNFEDYGAVDMDPEAEPDWTDEIGEIVKMVRVIVKLFRKSPTKNSILQSHMVEEFSHELQLDYAVITRWNSILTMLEKFYKAKDSIKKALTDINRLELWSNRFVDQLKEIIEVLKIIKMAMDELSKDEATLLTAEGALEFMFNELKEIGSPLSCSLLESIKVEIGKRRNRELVSLLKFLQNPQSLHETTESFFEMTSKKVIIKTAVDVWTTFFCPESVISEIDVPVETDENNQSSHDRLGMAVAKRSGANIAQDATAADSNKLIKLAVETLATTGVMPNCLKNIYEALLLIKPTSIKNEQNFSMSSNFLTKRRMKMSIQTLDDLCFTKSHLIMVEKRVNGKLVCSSQ